MAILRFRRTPVILDFRSRHIHVEDAVTGGKRYWHSAADQRDGYARVAKLVREPYS
jgi:hypothetical protein